MAPATATIYLTLNEAWVIRDCVRKQQEYGAVWDRSDMRELHSAILWLSQHPAEQRQVEMDESVLWLIEQQVPSALMVGSTPVGRDILIKVMVALQVIERERTQTTLEPEEPHVTDVPGGVASAFDADDRALKGFEAYLRERGKE
jgi:hypothetical protein